MTDSRSVLLWSQLVWARTEGEFAAAVVAAAQPSRCWERPPGETQAVLATTVGSSAFLSLCLVLFYFRMAGVSIIAMFSLSKGAGLVLQIECCTERLCCWARPWHDFQLRLRHRRGSKQVVNGLLRNTGEGERKKNTKVSLQVLNFTLSRSNHFAKYKHIFSHIQTAKYSVIFTFRYSA